MKKDYVIILKTGQVLYVPEIVAEAIMEVKNGYPSITFTDPDNPENLGRISDVIARPPQSQYDSVTYCKEDGKGFSVVVQDVMAVIPKSSFRPELQPRVINNEEIKKEKAFFEAIGVADKTKGNSIDLECSPMTKESNARIQGGHKRSILLIDKDGNEHPFDNVTIHDPKGSVFAPIKIKWADECE